jgi:protein-S-isoprenylcysteine O-methyltransferase
MPLLRTIAIVGFFLWLFIDSLAVFRHKTEKAENRDRFSLALIMVGNLVAWIVGIGLAFAGLGSMHSVPLQFAGLLVMAVGIVVRSTAIVQLGRFHTPNVAVRADHQLMNTGLYRYVRHPSYLGALIAFLGFSLGLGNWLSLAVIMGVTVCIYLYRMHEEEAALSAAFGDAYRAYSRTTKRLIPGLF